ncbi:hypothetical protein B0J18DRAFT_456744 [Chaetomium sp. MPI-SDFR-AT-0129]|nr:hypothetical protein B0J18DRAFT_456744 [Chaetomium sp. MPI-SDFR-AT-0129]
MAGRRPLDRPIDKLPNVVNEVLVTTAKAFRAASRDGRGNPAAAAATIETRIPESFEKFNALLDDLECDLLLSKAVLERDLKVTKAKRQPPPPPPQQKPVAPPAPMVVDLESPKLTAKTALASHGPSPSLKQANKPVAPFPNMGFEDTTLKTAATPSPKLAHKPKEVKNLARPVAASRPASAPPKNEPKAVPPPQPHRPGGVVTAPQTPLNAAAQLKAPSAGTGAGAAMSRQASAPGVGNVTGVAPASGNLFTDMTFSLAPTAGDTPLQKQAMTQAQRRASQQQQQQTQQQPLPGPSTATVNPGTGVAPVPKMEPSPAAGPADVANMGLDLSSVKVNETPNDLTDDLTNVDEKIDGLFDLGQGDMDNMDLEYDLGNGDNSNFNDLYFGSGDNNVGAGEFDDAFFNLEG